jgi:hypothetical protein
VTAPPDEELDTSAVDAAIGGQRLVRGRIAALLRAVESAMAAPEGEQWEQEISAAEEMEDPPKLTRPKSSSLEAREQKMREQFDRNWPHPGKPRKR